MIAYTDVYNRFINEIDDPQLNKACATNKIEFYKLCYKFLVNGLAYFTAPHRAAELLAVREEPVGQTEVIEGDGSQTYALELDIPEGADIVCGVVSGTTRKIDYGATVSNGSVTFSNALEAGETGYVEYYVAGKFNGDFGKTCGNMNKLSFSQRVVEILAKAMVVAWADKEQNFMLDIRNLLNDTDFKLHSPANSLKTKTEWVKDLKYDIYSIQNKLDWDLRHQNKSYYGY